MNNIARTCRFLFALSLVVFGVQHFMYADFVATLVPAWVPGHLFWAYFVGVAFIAASVSILINRFARLSFLMVGTMIMLFVLLIHVPKIAANPHEAGGLTNAFKDLAIGSAALMLGCYPIK